MKIFEFKYFSKSESDELFNSEKHAILKNLYLKCFGKSKSNELLNSKKHALFKNFLKKCLV